MAGLSTLLQCHWYLTPSSCFYFPKSSLLRPCCSSSSLFPVFFFPLPFSFLCIALYLPIIRKFLSNHQTIKKSHPVIYRATQLQSCPTLPTLQFAAVTLIGHAMSYDDLFSYSHTNVVVCAHEHLRQDYSPVTMTLSIWSGTSRRTFVCTVYITSSFEIISNLMPIAL